MKKRIVALSALLFVVFIGLGHEFWLQPKKYRFNVGEEMNVDFKVGESFTGGYWDLKRHKAEKLDIHSRSTNKSLLSQVKIGEGNNVTYKFSQPGTHLLAMQSNAAYIELDGEKFNEYLREDGLDEVLEERKKANELQKPSKEYYTRFAKLLVQAGDKTDDTYKKKTGQRLEIMLDQNPYAINVGDYLQCTILFDGKPSAHALVKVWNNNGTKVFLQNIYTENDGTIKFPISSKGPWMVSSVKMTKWSKDPSVYESLWASLVFGID